MNDLQRQLDRAMLRDQFRLRKQQQKIERLSREKKQVDELRTAYHEQLARSIDLRETRASQNPDVSFPTDLPINAKREEITQAIDENAVVVVCGETGSGKSTQLPKICLDMGRGISGFIGHTQPRRIAARSVAARIADELHSTLGQHVGYKIRFDDQLNDASYIKLMTDGILLAETRTDRFLENYDTIIIDEAHERSLNIDFLLGYIHQLLPKRPDLRLIITSATIDAERFADFFTIDQKPAPIVEVSGRGYPVETRYRPPDEENNNEDAAMQDALVGALDEACNEGGGDVLVFFPTERDIRETAKRLRGWSQKRGSRIDVLPLYARLPTKEQQRVFQSSNQRRIVLATNVAESSLTVPNIHYVIDTGTARLSRYAPRSKVQRLPIERISQASADQRQGRCGRIAPGVCLRLYSEDDYETRAPFTTPEIRRTNLANVILQMMSLRLGDVTRFPFIDPPHKEAVRDGFDTLYELGAIDAHRHITDLGKRMSRLPVDPRIARMILAGDKERCLAETLIIAAGLEVQDPRVRPPEKEQQADELHREFAHAESDFLSYLTLWDWFQHAKEEHSRSKLQRVCQRHFLSYNRLREWQDVHRQLKQTVLASGLKLYPRRDKYTAIHRSLLAGLLSNVALRSDRHEYLGAGEMKSYLWPGAGVFHKKPKWIVAAEVVETTKRYLRTVARVEPEWIEALAPHLVKRSFRKPHWSRKEGTVLALEKVTLFGLPVIPKRKSKYGHVDPAASRALFIQHALIEGDFNFRGAFVPHNRDIVEQLTSIAAKTRDRRFLIADADLMEFYHTRLPEHVCDEISLRKWWKKTSKVQRQRILMQQSDLMEDADVVVSDSFPSTVRAGLMELEVDYNFEPGEDHDGICVTVPIEGLSQVDQRQLDWLVPGLLHEKLVAMIRSLPKSLRTTLIPAPDVATKAAGMLDFGDGPFLTSVASVFTKLANEPIPDSAFDLTKLPQHLHVFIRVVDTAGKVIASGRRVDELQAQLGVQTAPESTYIVDERFEQDNVRSWEFGELPERIEMRRNGCVLLGYPMLVDCGTSISVRMHANQSYAQRSTHSAIRRLFLLAEHREIDDHVEWLPRHHELLQWAASLRHEQLFRTQLCELLAERSFFRDDALPRNSNEFSDACQRARKHLSYAVQDVAKLIVPLLEAYHKAACELDDLRRVQSNAVVIDVRAQIANLLHEGFLVETPWRWLEQFPRYLRAICVRLERLRTGGGARDTQGMRTLAPLLEEHAAVAAEHEQRGAYDVALEKYRWMLEEYRVSLFAQQLGTSVTVSPKRLAETWSRVDR